MTSLGPDNAELARIDTVLTRLSALPPHVKASRRIDVWLDQRLEAMGRTGGEMTHDEDRATVAEWGHAGMDR